MSLLDISSGFQNALVMQVATLEAPSRRNNKREHRYMTLLGKAMPDTAEYYSGRA